MKLRYGAYYRSIPNLGEKSAPPKNLSLSERRPTVKNTAWVSDRSVLEAMHPEIVQAVTLLWGYPEMDHYFEKLWLADGQQEPIAPEAMSELMLLASVHRYLTPQRPVHSLASMYDASAAPAPQPRDIWDNVPRRR
jgi:hypothetical protein